VSENIERPSADACTASAEGFRSIAMTTMSVYNYTIL